MSLAVPIGRECLLGENAEKLNLSQEHVVAVLFNLYQINEHAVT